MPDFPSFGVVCRVPAELVNRVYPADISVISTNNAVLISGVVAADDYRFSTLVTAEGKTGSGADAVFYTRRELSRVSRAMSACRANITDDEIRAALRLLSENLATLASTAPSRAPSAPTPAPRTNAPPSALQMLGEPLED